MILMPLLYIFLAISAVFNLLGTLSLFRFPDVYTRLHGTTKCTTFGSIFACFAVMVYSVKLWLGGEPQFGILLLHVFVVLAMLLLTNPTGAHALARATHRSGIMPKLAVVDKLKEAKLE